MIDTLKKLWVPVLALGLALGAAQGCIDNSGNKTYGRGGSSGDGATGGEDGGATEAGDDAVADAPSSDGPGTDAPADDAPAGDVAGDTAALDRPRTDTLPTVDGIGN